MQKKHDMRRQSEKPEKTWLREKNVPKPKYGNILFCKGMPNNMALKKRGGGGGGGYHAY